MSNKQTAIAQRSAAVAQRSAKGTFLPGASGNPLGNAQRARRELNADTIRAMHAAFRAGGREAIDKVMKQSPAIFLKLLVLLVPRELEVTHSGGVKAMSDEQLEAGIEAIQAMLAAREAGTAGENARVINAVPEDSETSEQPKTPVIRRKRGREASPSLPPDADVTDSVDSSNG
jgi:hypothetical protein